MPYRDIHLQYEVDLRAYDTTYWNPVVTQATIDQTLSRTTNTNFKLPPGTHTIQVPAYPSQNYAFHDFGYPFYQNPINVDITSDKVVTAFYTYIPYYTLSISSSGQGSTNLSGNPSYQSGTYAYVTANPSQGWSLDYWLLDSQNVGDNNPISVQMTSNRNLQAVFVQEQNGHDLEVQCYDQYYNPGYVPLAIDSQYVGTTMNTYTVSEGQHSVSVPSKAGYHVFYAWYIDGNYYYTTTASVSVYSDKTIVAYYIYPY